MVRIERQVSPARQDRLEEKPDRESYPTWLTTKFRSPPLSALEAVYEAQVAQAYLATQNSQYWHDLADGLRVWNDQYLIRNRLRLFREEPRPPELLRKSWPSFLLKTYRRNVLQNDAWPAEPVSGGWLAPGTWFSQVNDVLRCECVVQYLDGVEYLVTGLSELAATHSLRFRSNLEAKAEGYYAAHTYTALTSPLPDHEWMLTDTTVSLEIQVTTQLKAVIRGLTHAGYEKRRTTSDPPNVTWQWDYRSEEFITNYLGHIMHYLEGMIMEVRLRQSEEKHDE
jgi:hypothetical protein